MRILIAAAIVTAAALPASAQDLDRDGLDDALEQRLIEQFVPVFLLSADECDGVPASFVGASVKPIVAAQDGTIYAQATPAPGVDPSGHTIELHYFHLWRRDCGPNGHALDVEHVSALVTAGEATRWYAAAHEGTVCDASSIVNARTIDAGQHGPSVYVSSGKHASYFDRNACRSGCGGESCGAATQVAVARVINIGERGAPLNGAVWIASSRWPLAEKLGSDFGGGADRPRPSAADQATVLAGSKAVGSLVTARNAAGSAVKGALKSAGKFLNRK